MRKIRFGVVVPVTVVLTVVLAGCGAATGDQSSGDPNASTSSDPPTATSIPPSTTPTQSPSTAAKTHKSSDKHQGKYAEMAGTWASKKGEWVLHLKANRHFVEDFEGVKDLRKGTYVLKGNRFTLKGGDGNFDTGTFDGKQIRFHKYVLTQNK